MITEEKLYKNEIDTPALLIDLEAVDYNIKTMSNYFAGVKANLRPHFKTHKSPIIAHRQLIAGAIGITCAKLDEAQVLVEAGIDNILIVSLSEEHGKIRLSDEKMGLTAGDVIELIPGHGCTTFNLYDEVHGIRGHYRDITWKLQARGGFH